MDYVHRQNHALTQQLIRDAPPPAVKIDEIIESAWLHKR